MAAWSRGILGAELFTKIGRGMEEHFVLGRGNGQDSIALMNVRMRCLKQEINLSETVRWRHVAFPSKISFGKATTEFRSLHRGQDLHFDILRSYDVSLPRTNLLAGLSNAPK